MQDPPQTDDPPEFGPEAEHSWEDVVELPPIAEQSTATLSWATKIGDRVPGSPTVLDGTVYVPSLGNGLHGLEIDGGSETWTYELTFGTAASPAVHDGIAYLVTVFGHVVAVDVRANETVWESTRGGEYSRLRGFNPSALVADGRVFVGKADGLLYAYDAASGEVDWEFATDDSILASAVYHDGTVVVPSSDGFLYGVHATDGTEQWSVRIEGLGYSSPTLADGVVYVGSETGNVHARDAATGEEVWIADRDGEVVATPTVADGTVFVGDYGDLAPAIVALDAADGEVLWSGQRGSVTASPTVAGDRVYVAESHVQGYGIESGERELLFTEAGRGFHSSPTVVDGTLYVGCNDGKVYAVDTGADATSRGSRVSDGTFGHTSARTGASVRSDAGGSDGSGSAESGDSDGGGDGALTGPGIGGAVGSLLGGKLLLDRLRSDDDPSGSDGVDESGPTRSEE